MSFQSEGKGSSKSINITILECKLKDWGVLGTGAFLLI